MKKVLGTFLLSALLLSCNNMTKIEKADICGKKFSSSTPSPLSSGLSTDTGTTLNCDGTFESGAVSRSENLVAVGFGSRNLIHFTGTWDVINDIPDSVKAAVKEYGLLDNNYSIIKYSSSNGVLGYCLYYKNSIGGYICLEPLYMGQVPTSTYENNYGALGICGGELDK